MAKLNHQRNEEAQRRRDIDERYKRRYGKQDLKSKQQQIEKELNESKTRNREMQEIHNFFDERNQNNPTERNILRF